jgi:hypothetical protein
MTSLPLLSIAANLAIKALIGYFLFLFELRNDSVVVKLRDHFGPESKVMNTDVWAIVSMYPNIMIKLRGTAIIATFALTCHSMRNWQPQKRFLVKP